VLRILNFKCSLKCRNMLQSHICTCINFKNFLGLDFTPAYYAETPYFSNQIAVLEEEVSETNLFLIFGLCNIFLQL